MSVTNSDAHFLLIITNHFIFFAHISECKSRISFEFHTRIIRITSQKFFPSHWPYLTIPHIVNQSFQTKISLNPCFTLHLRRICCNFHV